MLRSSWLFTIRARLSTVASVTSRRATSRLRASSPTVSTAAAIQRYAVASCTL